MGELTEGPILMKHLVEMGFDAGDYYLELNVGRFIIEIRSTHLHNWFVRTSKRSREYHVYKIDTVRKADNFLEILNESE